MSISENELLELIANGLNCDLSTVTLDSSSENMPEWDSVAHLSILGLLEDSIAGVLDEHPELAEARSVSSILAIIRSVSR